MPRAIHFTNGDSAAELIRMALLGAKVIPWRDVLHEGPVPAKLSFAALRKERAHFIAGKGWGKYAQVLTSFRKRDLALLQPPAYLERVLWFEHDLYDQLQLIQILHALSRLPVIPRVSLIQTDEYLTSCVVPDLKSRYLNRQVVSKKQIKAAAEIWEAFRKGNPLQWQQFAEQHSAVFPHVAPALKRLLEELPSIINGLSRTEQQILEELSSGPLLLPKLYAAAHHQREPATYMGDTTFVEYVKRLALLQNPLIVSAEGKPLSEKDFSMNPVSGLPDLALKLSVLGEKVLHGEVDFSKLATHFRWLGGLCIDCASPAFRWDSERYALVPQQR